MKRGAVVGIIAGAAAVVVAGGAVALWALNRPASVEDAAETYLRALSEGDFDTIDGMLPDSADRDELRATFEGATGRIEDYTFEVSSAGGMQAVSAEVTLAGEEAEIGFVLADGPDGWGLAADFLASLAVTTPLGDGVRVGGAHTGLDVSLLPAVYPVAPAPTGILSGTVEVAVTNRAPVTVDLQPTLTPEATTLAQEQLDAYAAQCAAATEAVPEDCGLRVPWAADLASLDAIAFRIDRPPVVALSPDAKTFAATGGVIVATASGTTDAGDAASFTYRADDWALRGVVRFTATEMELLVG